MPNLMEAIKGAFYTITDDEAIAFEEAGLHTTDDDELKGMLVE
jgi:hypothetical protein